MRRKFLNPLVILGAGGFAREVFSWIDKDQYQVSAFFSDSPEKSEIYGVPVISDLKLLSKMEFVCAIGDPKTRREIVKRAYENLMIPAMPVIGEQVIIGNSVLVAKGSIICPGTVITTDIVIGEHTIININCTIGHDCKIGDFVTISPGANISGNVHIGHNSYIGTGSVVREGKKIGENSTLGMGGVLIKDLPDNSVWIGNPAGPIERRLKSV